MTAKVEILASDPVLLGEGPHWDVSNQALYYVDITGGDVHRYDTKTNLDTSKHVGKYATFVIPRRDDDNELVIGNELSIQILNWKSEHLKTIASVDQDKPTNRLNDAKCDAAGRLWAGTMNITKDPYNMILNDGNLFSLDAKYNLVKRVPNVSISNGTAWSHDNSLMYYIDSIPRVVSVYDYDLASGNIGKPRPVIDFNKYGEEFALPDGMTIDNNGKLWIACCGGSRVIQCDPETGKLLQVVKLPTKRITSVCFGGPQLTDLYVTSIRDGLTEEELKADPLAGKLFKITEHNASGREHYTFAG